MHGYEINETKFSVLFKKKEKKKYHYTTAFKLRDKQVLNSNVYFALIPSLNLLRLLKNVIISFQKFISISGSS